MAIKKPGKLLGQTLLTKKLGVQKKAVEKEDGDGEDGNGEKVVKKVKEPGPKSKVSSLNCICPGRTADSYRPRASPPTRR